MITLVLVLPVSPTTKKMGRPAAAIALFGGGQAALGLANQRIDLVISPGLAARAGSVGIAFGCRGPGLFLLEIEPDDYENDQARPEPRPKMR